MWTRTASGRHYGELWPVSEASVSKHDNDIGWRQPMMYLPMQPSTRHPLLCLQVLIVCDVLKGIFMRIVVQSVSGSLYIRVSINQLLITHMTWTLFAHYLHGREECMLSLQGGWIRALWELRSRVGITYGAGWGTRKRCGYFSVADKCDYILTSSDPTGSARQEQIFQPTRITQL